MVQIKYDRPRVERWVNPRLPWRTQHDFADAVGAPWVVSTSLQKFPDAVAASLEFLKGQAPGSRLPSDYGDAAILARARRWLEQASRGKRR